MENITITILDPKVKGLLSELQHLGLIEINDQAIEEQKQQLIDKLSGQNLKDIDSQQLHNLLKK